MDEEFLLLDYLGNKIAVGDKVVCLWHRDTSSRFVRRTVLRLTRCYVVTEDKHFPPDKVIVVERKNGKKLYQLERI